MRNPQREIEMILMFGDNALSPEQKSRRLQELRSACPPETSRQMDEFLIKTAEERTRGLLEAQEIQKKQAALIQELTCPPWYPAKVLDIVPHPGGDKVLVYAGGRFQCLGVTRDVDIHSLATGDDVLLSEKGNVIIAKAGRDLFVGGETAAFRRALSEDRIVVASRDEEIVVRIAQALKREALKSGDLIRWDRSLMLAIEVIEKSKGSEMFLEETPTVTFEAIGGLDAQIGIVKAELTNQIRHPEIFQQYEYRRIGSLMLIGPPGTGKTMLAKALANFVATLYKAGRSRFINVKPSALNSMWFGQSEANYREVFRVARDAAASEPDIPVIIYFDEVDSIGAARGQTMNRVHDRVLQAFMAELDGLESRGNILVVSSTNRPDALDPGLARPGRLGDKILRVPRPTSLGAARDILSKYLSPRLPYARNGHGQEPSEIRDNLIECAVSQMLSPNSDGDLATVVYRSGRRRTVKPSDLINGAILANIAEEAKRLACSRHIEIGDAGLRLEDLLAAIDAQFHTAADNLTPFNCRLYLLDIPDDADVVSVERKARKTAQSHRYIHAA